MDPETPEQERLRLLRELEGKNIAYYSVMLGAWIETRMERDKTLVKLSAAGIGLLVTILLTVGVRYWFELIPYVIAFAGFVFSIWISLAIYEKNTVYIEDQLRGNASNDLKLKKYDRLSKYSFLIAAVFAILIGVESAITTIFQQGSEMTQQPKPTAEEERINQSIQGFQKLAPSDMSKSLDGAEKLKPTMNKPQPPQVKPQGSQNVEGQANTPQPPKSGK